MNVQIKDVLEKINLKPKEKEILEIVIPCLGSKGQIKKKLLLEDGSIISNFPYSFYIDNNKVIIRDDFELFEDEKLDIKTIRFNYSNIDIENKKYNNMFRYRVYYRMIKLPF